MEMVELADFEPEADYVKVKVEAAGLGLPDVFMCANTYPAKPPLPFVPSQEAVGTITDVGQGIEESLIGTRVLGVTGFDIQRGGLAEYCLMPKGSFLQVPDDMPAEEAAGFFIPYQTAWVGLLHRARLQQEETVLVLGASGSSGYAAIQLAKAMGCKVIAVAGGPEKVAFCESLGVDGVIDYRTSDVGEAALELTDGKGVDVIYDPVGGALASSAFEAISREGRFVVIGFASGEWANIPMLNIVTKNASLLGALPDDNSLFLKAHTDLINYWEKGLLDMGNIKVFQFEEGRDAVQHIASQQVQGKVVVKI